MNACAFRQLPVGAMRSNYPRLGNGSAIGSLYQSPSKTQKSARNLNFG
jgi:hypothetical protein